MHTNPESQHAIQPEMLPGESILWAGQPSGRVVLHKQDWFLVPFSVFWGGFSIFWEGGVAGWWLNSSEKPWSLGIFWGLFFVAIGQYLIWGRFVHAAWKKKRTHFAVTNQRVIGVQVGRSRRLASAYIDTLPMLTKEGGGRGIGTIRFTPAGSTWSRNRGSDIWTGLEFGTTPALVDIADVDAVYRLIAGLRDSAKGPRRTF